MIYVQTKKKRSVLKANLKSVRHYNRTNAKIPINQLLYYRIHIMIRPLSRPIIFLEIIIARPSQFVLLGGPLRFSKFPHGEIHRERIREGPHNAR